MKIKQAMRLAGGLANVKRYSQSTLCHSESVMEHSGFVTMMALIIGNDLKHHMQIDFAVLLSRAIMHDADEYVTGDIARPVKYHSKEIRGLLAEMEEDHMKSISQDLGMEDLFIAWKNAKEGYEGSIIALCDTLAVVHKVHDEVCNRGNRTMQGHGANLVQLVKQRLEAIASFIGYFPESLVDIERDCSQILIEIQTGVRK